MKHLIYILVSIFIISCTNSRFNRGSYIPSDENPVNIPFDEVEELIVFDAVVNGIEGRFVLDNGFTLSAVNPEFADRVGIIFEKETNINDANNRTAGTKETTVDSVVIAGHAFLKTGFYLIDTDVFLPCDEIDGIIGASIINKTNWQMDFSTKSMAISSTPFNARGIILPVEYSGNNSGFLNLGIKDRTLRLKIDFGLSEEFKLEHDDIIEALIGEMAEKRIGVSSLSTNGMAISDTFYNLQNISINYNNTELPEPGDLRLKRNLKYDGYIGIEYFKKYVFTLNSSNQELILSEYPADKKDDKVSKTYGMAIYPIDGDWNVIQLNPHIGVLSTDHLMKEVERLDGEAISRFDWCSYRAYARERAEQGESLTISFKGDTSSIVVPYREVVKIELGEN